MSEICTTMFATSMLFLIVSIGTSCLGMAFDWPPSGWPAIVATGSLILGVGFGVAAVIGDVVT